MTTDMTQNRKLTWNRLGGLTLAVLILCELVGVWLMRQRVFLAPPMAASTFYFYIAVAALPALITFLVGVWARPTGKRIMVVALPVFGSVIFVIYLILIGPGFSYTDIQCQAASGSRSASRLDCSCRFEFTSGKGSVKCPVVALAPLPLIRLVEEKWGAPPNNAVGADP
jgi:hypothetical protein